MNAADKSMAAMRKQVREQDEISLVNKRAYSIFRSMLEKARDEKRDSEIDFDVEKLRAESRNCRGTACRWCGRTITAKNFSWDHRIPTSRGGTYSFENLQLVCSVSNGQKGNMTVAEFSELLALIKVWDEKARADVLRRLGLGARWRS
jgi:5-methylcytosine-specific restriction endonuclease McrA